MTPKKQTKRHKAKRAALKKVKRELEELPEYLRRPDTRPTLVTAHWARRDLENKKFHMDPVLKVVGRLLTKFVVAAKDIKAVERALPVMKIIHGMEMQRYRAELNLVAEETKSDAQDKFTVAQVEANRLASRQAGGDAVTLAGCGKDALLGTENSEGKE